jgi:hypothetical protein
VDPVQDFKYKLDKKLIDQAKKILPEKGKHCFCVVSSIA